MDEKEKVWFADVPNFGTIVPKTAWAVIVGLVLAGVLYVGKVYAKDLGTVENPAGTRITLTDAPCDVPQVAALVSANVPEEYQLGWKKLDAVFAIKPDMHIERFEGCYLEAHGTVLLVFADGDHFTIPRAAFKKVGVDA